MCTTINFDNQFQLLGKYHSQGLMVWEPGWTFNGVVTTPPDYYREISSDINLYTEWTNSHDLFIQVQDVVGGHFGYATGGAFDALTIVGVEVSDPSLSAITPFYSGMFANPGEYLQGTLGDCSMSRNVPLSSTPGWGLASANSGTFVVQTVSTPTNGFTGPWGCIYGTYRIINGGVFMLDFDTNLNQSVGAFDVSVIYGYNSQKIQAATVPEPTTILKITGGLLGCLAFSRRCLKM
jgi:hypothetical protein